MPVVKVIDFGVAKALNQELTERTLFTQFSQMIGTPLYMSPEQADIGGLDIDTRADIYSLGVLLYELLTGTTPFDKDRLKSVPFDELRRIIREEEPETVSQRLSKTRRVGSAHQSSRPAACAVPVPLTRRLSELDWITAKSLEKDRTRRYQSASSLAADVQRYLANKPITARPVSLTYRFRKWLCRNPTTASFAVLGTLTVAAALLGGWYHNHHLTDANLALDSANHSLNAANQKLSEALADSKRLEAQAVEREQLVRLQTYARDMRFAYKAWLVEQPREALTYLNRYQPQPGEPDLRGFEWYCLSCSFPPASRPIAGHLAPLIAADISPDGRWIASGDKIGVIKIWESAAGSEVKTLQYADAEITSITFAPDGQTLATAGVDRTIRLWNVEDWSEIGSLRGHEMTVASIAWSADGRQLASGGRDHHIKIWDVEQRREIHTLPKFSDVVRCVAWSPTGQHLAAAVREDGLHLIDTQTWQPEHLLHLKDIGGLGARALSFSPSGKLLASGGYGGRLFVHDVAARKQLADVKIPGVINSLVFSPDQRLLFVGFGSGEVLTYSVDGKQHPLSGGDLFGVGQGDLRAVRIASSGRTVVTAEESPPVVQVRSLEQFTTPRQDRSFNTTCLSISARQDLACTLNSRGLPQLVSFPGGQTLGPLEGAPGGKIKSARFFPAGDKLVINDGVSLHLFDTSSRRHLGDFEASGDQAHQVVVSPLAAYIAATVLRAGEPQLCIWNAHTLRRAGYLPLPLPTLDLRLAFSPDDQILAVASPHAGEGQVTLWNLSTRTIIDKISETPIDSLKFSPDGQLLALARGWDVLIWNLKLRKLTTVLRGHSADISELAFSPAGRTLATVDREGTLRLWHVPTRQEIGILTKRALPASQLLFRSPYELINYPDADVTAPAISTPFLRFEASQAANVTYAGELAKNDEN